MLAKKKFILFVLNTILIRIKTDSLERNYFLFITFDIQGHKIPIYMILIVLSE